MRCPPLARHLRREAPSAANRPDATKCLCPAFDTVFTFGNQLVRRIWTEIIWGALLARTFGRRDVAPRDLALVRIDLNDLREGRCAHAVTPIIEDEDPPAVEPGCVMLV